MKKEYGIVCVWVKATQQWQLITIPSCCTACLLSRISKQNCSRIVRPSAAPFMAVAQYHWSLLTSGSAYVRMASLNKKDAACDQHTFFMYRKNHVYGSERNACLCLNGGTACKKNKDQRCARDWNGVQLGLARLCMAVSHCHHGLVQQRLENETMRQWSTGDCLECRSDLDAAHLETALKWAGWRGWIFSTRAAANPMYLTCRHSFVYWECSREKVWINQI